MVNADLKSFFLRRAVTLDEYPESHRNTFKKGFIAATIYSILYGFYEYFVVYNYPRILDFYNIMFPGNGHIFNWIIMYAGIVITVAIATKFSIEQSIMGLMYMAMLEDVFFWISQWIDTGIFPFPAGNWWDSTLATFRVLGGLGQAIPFWPFTPLYYIPGFIMVLVFYVSSYKGAKSSRIAAWAIGPLFLAIIIGALADDAFAIFSLITVPTISYTYLIILLFLNKKRREIG
jgi:hypothetical protein